MPANKNAPKADFSFQHEEEKGMLYMTLHTPKFDAAHTHAFLSALDTQWPQGVSRVEIEMGEVTFIDSSGIGALLSVAKKLPPQSEPLLLHHPREQVVNVMELLRLQRVFRFE